MRSRRAILAVAVVAGVAALGPCAPSAAAEGAEPSLYRLALGGKVRAVRAIDVDGDRRRDLVVVLDAKVDEAIREEVVVLRTPKAPVASTFYDPARVVRIACDGPAAATRVRAAVVAVGRFGAAGEVRLRFLSPDGAVDVDPTDATAKETVSGGPALLGRVPGAPIAFWEAVA